MTKEILFELTCLFGVKATGYENNLSNKLDNKENNDKIKISDNLIKG